MRNRDRLTDGTALQAVDILRTSSGIQHGALYGVVGLPVVHVEPLRVVHLHRFTGWQRLRKRVLHNVDYIFTMRPVALDEIPDWTFRSGAMKIQKGSTLFLPRYHVNNDDDSGDDRHEDDGDDDVDDGNDIDDHVHEHDEHEDVGKC